MVDVMAVGAHPDDVEFGCGGILAKMASQGKSILIVDLTLGEKGTHGTPSERRDESHAAAHIIGAERINLEMGDCEVADTYENRLKLVALIREYKPQLVLAPMWKGEQNHPDHLACGLLARYACRFARFGTIMPEKPLHRPNGILHYTQRNFEEPTAIVDISEHVDTWMKMVCCHKSQMHTFPYDKWVLEKASLIGKLIGVTHAEGLVAGNPIAIDDVMHIATGTQEI